MHLLSCFADLENLIDEVDEVSDRTKCRVIHRSQKWHDHVRCTVVLVIRKYIEDRDAMVPGVLPLRFEREHFATRHFFVSCIHSLDLGGKSICHVRGIDRVPAGLRYLPVGVSPSLK